MLAQAPKQTLLLFKGHPGSGKSTLAAALARHWAWPLIDKDDIKDHLVHLPDSGYLSFEILWKIARHQLEIGLSVLVDSTLSYQTTYETGLRLANEFHTRLLVVETTLPESHWRARLDRRLQELQTHRTSGWDAMQKLLGEYNNSWQYPIAPEHHLIVDTSQPLEDLVLTLDQHLAQLS